MAKKRPGTITIFEGRKGGGSRRAGKVKSFRRSGRFTASFIPDGEWDITIDARDLQAVVSAPIHRHLKRSIAADRDPETGAQHPKTISTRKTGGLSKKALGAYRESGGKKLGRNTTRDRDVDTVAMSKALRRTVMDTRWSYKREAGGWVRTPERARVVFYFVADQEPYSKWNAINKADSTRSGKGRIVWLGLGGQAGKIIRPGLERWAELVLSGAVFVPDSVSKANGGS